MSKRNTLSFKGKISNCPVLVAAASKLVSACVTNRGVKAFAPLGTESMVFPARFFPYKSSTFKRKGSSAITDHVWIST